MFPRVFLDTVVVVVAFVVVVFVVSETNESNDW